MKRVLTIAESTGRGDAANSSTIDRQGSDKKRGVE